jgi:hypothetical protein
MNPQDNHALWRNRFIVKNLVQIGGTLLVLLALGLWFGDLVKEGGAPVIGFPLALIGVTISFFGPKWLAGYWRRQDGR